MTKNVIWLLLLAFLQSPAFAASGAYVNDVDGKALLTRNQETRPLKKGAELSRNDTISVPQDGRVDVTMNDLVGIRLLSESVMSVGTTQEMMSATVLKGNVLVHTKKLSNDSSFHLETPTVVAAVRGTQFWGRVDNSKGLTTTMAVREGEIEIRDRATSGRTVIKAGEAVDITAGKPSQARKALPAELAAMSEAPEIPTGRV